MSKGKFIGGKHLIALRKSTKTSQKQFAELTGIAVDSIRSWEQGRRMLTVEKYREIKSLLGYVSNSQGNLRVMIDYLRITFKHVRDLDFFCRKFLYCRLEEFVSEETRMLMYTHLWRRGDIWIFDFGDKSKTENYQITLQLSGAGCRQMELIFEREGLTWSEFLQKIYFEGDDMKVTRLDVAMDEMYRGFENESDHFLLSDMIARVYQGQVVFDKLKTWNHIGGGQLLFHKVNEMDLIDDGGQGISLYFGSRQSNLYFNFYEKRYEIARKEKMTLSESLEVFGIWNRYELRFSQEKAHKAVEEYVCGIDLAEIAKGIINKEMQVYDGTNPYGAFLPDKKWQSLFGGVEPLKLSVSPEAYSIERTVKWLMFQVADSLALVDEADKIMDTKYLEMILDSGAISERGQKVLDLLNSGTRKDIEEYLRE